MGKNKNKSSDKISLTLSESLLPISLLIIMLSFNVYVYGDSSMSGSNQFILLLEAGSSLGYINNHCIYSYDPICLDLKLRA